MTHFVMSAAGTVYFFYLARKYVVLYKFPMAIYLKMQKPYGRELNTDSIFFYLFILISFGNSFLLILRI